MGFALPPNRYVCIANHRAVFLDVDKNRYFCLPPELEAAFQGLLSNADESTASTTDITRLIKLGIVVPAAVHTLSVQSAPSTDGPSSRFDKTFSEPPPWQVARAAYFQIQATCDLAKRPMREVVRDLKTAKTKSASNPPPPSVPSRYIAAYKIATRFLSAQDQCLRTAIAFTRLLNRDGYFPDLVIGVRMSPFRAHAWVQDRGAVLTDALDTVLPFTPILVI